MPDPREAIMLIIITIAKFKGFAFDALTAGFSLFLLILSRR
ncbi:hypothetical protein FM109_00485 [Vibrio casei]|nr:hypothetical protein FM109_00485 [Vibrio casei]